MPEHYAAALPRAMQKRIDWQTAAEMLILAAQGQRPVMFADIAMRRALHAGKGRAVFRAKSRNLIGAPFRRAQTQLNASWSARPTILNWLG